MDSGWLSSFATWFGVRTPLEIVLLISLAAVLAVVIVRRNAGKSSRPAGPEAMSTYLAWDLARQIRTELRTLAPPRPGTLPTEQPVAAKATAKLRVRTYIDLPNFEQTHHKTRGGKGRVDWARLTTALLEQVQKTFDWQTEDVGTHIYDAFIPYDDLARYGVTLQEAASHYRHNARFSLIGELAILPGIQLHLFDRSIDKADDGTPKRGADGRLESSEKGVDTQLVTDLLVDAHADEFDVALLLSADSDFIPAVEAVQRRLNKKVIQVGFGSNGVKLRGACWAAMQVDDVVPLQARSILASMMSSSFMNQASKTTGEAEVTPPAAPQSGEVYDATITRVLPAGLTIDFTGDFGTKHGFIHKSQGPEGEMTDPESQYAVGQIIKAKFTFYDERSGQPRLTLRDVTT